MAPQFFQQRLRFFALLSVLIACRAMVNVTAQVNDNNLDHKTYAVTGAFNIGNNAIRKIKGWEGKLTIFTEHSTQADQNVRIEIQILKE